jgi:hypothetical protein
MKVRIYKPSKNVMQSGRARTQGWVLEYEPETPRQPEPLMGWTAAGDTLGQVRLHFASVEDAVAYAHKKGWGYTVLPAHERRVVPRNYVDNFKYIPPEPDKSGKQA